MAANVFGATETQPQISLTKASRMQNVSVLQGAPSTVYYGAASSCCVVSAIKMPYRGGMHASGCTTALDRADFDWDCLATRQMRSRRGFSQCPLCFKHVLAWCTLEGKGSNVLLSQQHDDRVSFPSSSCAATCTGGFSLTPSA
jgi:hypothetical protein